MHAGAWVAASLYVAAAGLVRLMRR
jgi:hypothetical protein